MFHILTLHYIIFWTWGCIRLTVWPSSLEVSFVQEPCRWSNLKGCWVNVFTHGCPSPLPLHSSLLWPGWSHIDLLELLWGWWRGRLVSQPTYLLQWVGMQHLWPHLWLRPLSVNVFHRKELLYPGLSPLLWWGQSWHHAAYLLLGVPSRNEWGHSS